MTSDARVLKLRERLPLRVRDPAGNCAGSEEQVRVVGGGPGLQITDRHPRRARVARLGERGLTGQLSECGVTARAHC